MFIARGEHFRRFLGPKSFERMDHCMRFQKAQEFFLSSKGNLTDLKINQLNNQLRVNLKTDNIFP
jgi:hypothetical protein